MKRTLQDVLKAAPRFWLENVASELFANSDTILACLEHDIDCEAHHTQGGPRSSCDCGIREVRNTLLRFTNGIKISMSINPRRRVNP